MKYDFAIFTTDGEETNLPVPVAMSKIVEVSRGSGNFSCEQDKQIALWILEVVKILALR